MKATCLVCDKDLEATHPYEVMGDSIFVCDQCRADARLGRLVRKALETGPVEIWEQKAGGYGARFAVDDNPGATGETIEAALIAAGVEEEGDE